MQVGLVGLGRMGTAMAARLKTFGIEPSAWDISQDARFRAGDAGLHVAANPRAVAEASDIVITTITEDNGVRGLFTGPSGFLEGDVKGKLFIEMSTLRPETVRSLSGVLGMRGAAIVDSPVLGSIPTVLEGKLLSLAGGDAKDIERARPVLEKLTRAIVHLGSVGAGHTMKLAVNLVMANYLQSLAEALAMGAENGLQLDQMLDVFANSPLANGILANKLPRLRGGPETMTLDLKTLRKDVQSALATGSTSGVSMPATAGALDALASANALGWGEHDISEIVAFMRDHMVQRT
jgi:3-hydroxyisobutyrate dehydrogenase-like beta-hydroxyacid dehydrogenase